MPELSGSSFLHPAASRSADAGRALCSLLRASGYDVAALQQRLGVSGADDAGLLNRPVLRERLRSERDRLALLIRLFFLEDALGPGEARRVLPRALQSVLTRSRLVALRRGSLHSLLRVDPVHELYIFSDRRFPPSSRRVAHLSAGDMVYAPGADSLLLAEATPLAPGLQVLDLCTGSGVQALRAAHAGASVLAVDVQPRAVELAHFNAAVNGVQHFASRVGDLYRGSSTRSFDLILGNPPFVPGPRRGPSYHSGGPRGVDVLSRIVRGWERYLRPGGRALCVSHLALRAREDVGDVIRPWVGRLPGRVAVFVVESGTIVDLAAAQALFALDRGLASYAREVRGWVSYLRRRRIRKIVVLLIAAQKDGRPSRFEVIDAAARTLPLPLSAPPAQRVQDWWAA